MRESFREDKPEVFDFIKFLDDMWYRELSLFSHPEPFGLAQIRPILMNNNTKQLRIFKNENLWLSSISIISIASEIEIALNFELKTKLAYIWAWFVNHSNIAKEIYEMRYQKPLNKLVLLV